MSLLKKLAELLHAADGRTWKCRNHISEQQRAAWTGGQFYFNRGLVYVFALQSTSMFEISPWHLLQNTETKEIWAIFASLSLFSLPLLWLQDVKRVYHSCHWAQGRANPSLSQGFTCGDTHTYGDFRVSDPSIWILFLKCGKLSEYLKRAQKHLKGLFAIKWKNFL